MTAMLVLGILCVILISATTVAITVLVSRALSSAFSSLDSMHKRSAEQQDRLLDRLMTIRWEDLIAMRSAEEPETGGFFAPGEQEDEGVTVEEPGKWGALSQLAERIRLSSEEQQMLDEDFPVTDTTGRAP